MNILTFDIEEWYLQKKYLGNRADKYVEYDRYLGRILDALDEWALKGTFFCLGGMGRNFSEVIQKIDERGHEVGCHSDQHLWLNKMTRQEVEEDTHRAVDSLEQCLGKKIKSFRAPAFSIGEQNKWAFEVLAKNGIERDASVFPVARDFGGFPNFGQKTPTLVRLGDVTLKEFPICTTRILGHELAYSGGGYFRFFPLWFVKQQMRKTNYSMTYFHIGDLLPETNAVKSKSEYEEYFKEPGTLKNRYIRYVKSNLGKKHTMSKLLKLIATVDFINLEQADQQTDWSKVPVVSWDTPAFDYSRNNAIDELASLNTDS